MSEDLNELSPDEIDESELILLMSQRTELGSTKLDYMKQFHSLKFQGLKFKVLKYLGSYRKYFVRWYQWSYICPLFWATA